LAAGVLAVSEVLAVTGVSSFAEVLDVTSVFDCVVRPAAASVSAVADVTYCVLLVPFLLLLLLQLTSC